MKISIITVSYNSAKTIRDTIKSVVNQSYNNIEYIVIDGGSSDETLSIVEEYKAKIHHVISEKDEGIYDAMNKGVAKATGDVIGILNSDDFYTDNNVIVDVVKLLEKSEADACYADLMYVDQEDTSKVVRKWISGSYKKNKFRRGWMPPHPTFFLKKSCYEKFGAFNLNLKSSADYECMLRMMYKFDSSVAYLNRVIIKMREGGQSNVSILNRLKANNEDRRAWGMNELKPAWYTLYMKPLSKVKQFFV